MHTEGSHAHAAATPESSSAQLSIESAKSIHDLLLAVDLLARSGSVLVPVDRCVKEHYRLEPSQLESALNRAHEDNIDSKVLLLTSPCNPTTQILSEVN